MDTRYANKRVHFVNIYLSLIEHEAFEQFKLYGIVLDAFVTFRIHFNQIINLK